MFYIWTHTKYFPVDYKFFFSHDIDIQNVCNMSVFLQKFHFQKIILYIQPGSNNVNIQTNCEEYFRCINFNKRNYAPVNYIIHNI